jgi:hypothetical protein
MPNRLWEGIIAIITIHSTMPLEGGEMINPMHFKWKAYYKNTFLFIPLCAKATHSYGTQTIKSSNNLK